MNKKEIYEHLASIYLDNSRKRKKKARLFPRYEKFFPASVISVLFISLVFAVSTFKKSGFTRQVALVIQPTTIKLNFNSGATKKEVYSFDLNGIDLSKFDALLFSARKARPSDAIFLRVELSNALQETSEVYIKEIKYKWQDYKINFADFKKITDWSRVSKVAFVIEEWNVTGDKGVIYIDNVKMIKERG